VNSNLIFLGWQTPLVRLAATKVFDLTSSNTRNSALRNHSYNNDVQDNPNNSKTNEAAYLRCCENLSESVILVPTEKSGRKFLELLLAEKIKSNAVPKHVTHSHFLNPPIVITPKHFPRMVLNKTFTPTNNILAEQSGNILPIASNWERYMGWRKALQLTSTSTLNQLTANKIVLNTHSERVLATTIAELHTTVTCSLHSFKDVYRIISGGLISDEEYGIPDSETARWEALSQIEEIYFKVLAEVVQKTDEFDAICRLLKSEIKIPFKQLYVIGLIEQSNVIKQLLELLNPTPIILIGAPESYKNAFTNTGALRPDIGAQICLPSEQCKKVRIKTASSPLNEAELSIAWLNNLAANSEKDINDKHYDKNKNNQKAVFVFNDEESSATFTQILNMAGIPTHLGAILPFRQSRLGLLTDIIVKLADKFSSDVITSAIRNPFIFSWISRQVETNADNLSIISAFDYIATKHVPDIWHPDAIYLSASDSNKEKRISPQLIVKHTLQALQKLISPLVVNTKISPIEACEILLAILFEIIESETLDAEEYSALVQPLINLGNLLHNASKETLELSSCAEHIGDILLLLENSAAFPVDLHGEGLEVIGWLELPLNDATNVAISGANEGLLPKKSAISTDSFLPDSLRRRLGLPNDTSQLERDAFILKQVCNSRDSVLITAHTRSLNDTPRLPSRLIVQGSASQAAQRYLEFFSLSENSEHTLSIPNGTIFDASNLLQWQTPLPEEGAVFLRPLSASSLKLYQQCPYRFYLRYILNLRGFTDSFIELSPQIYGNLIHSIHYEAGKKELSGDVSPESLETLFTETGETISEAQFLPYPTVATKVQLVHLADSILAMAKTFNTFRLQGWKPWAVELKITSLIENIPFLAVIDRVEYHQQTKSFRIIDVKTGYTGGGSLSKHSSLKKRDGSWKDIQLPMYAVLLRDFLKEQNVEVQNIESCYLTFSSNSHPIIINFSDEELDDALSFILTIAKKARYGPYMPPSTLPFNDEFKRLII
jgi:ATP-dependent helicase/nuclease subunit B